MSFPRIFVPNRSPGDETHRKNRVVSLHKALTIDTWISNNIIN
jgi:hypothetical protein